jgi:hypothetical protein
MEDDTDWDVSIKAQLQSFAHAVESVEMCPSGRVLGLFMAMVPVLENISRRVYCVKQAEYAARRAHLNGLQRYVVWNCNIRHQLIIS